MDWIAGLSVISALIWMMAWAYRKDEGHWPWSEQASALRRAVDARNTRLASLVTEYVGYGYAEPDAWQMARDKMNAEAKAAKAAVDGVTNG